MPKQVNRNQDFTFTITKELGVLSRTSAGWAKEVNLVEWNGNPVKLDIRDWDPDHAHMGRGITLHKHEVLELLEILLKAFGKDLAKAREACKKAEAEVSTVETEKNDDAVISASENNIDADQGASEEESW